MRKLWIGGPLLALVLGLGWFAAKPAFEPDPRPGPDEAVTEIDPAAEAPPAPTAVSAGSTPVPHRAGAGSTEARPDPLETTREAEDRAIFREKLALVREEGLDTLPLGQAIARLGTSFLGTKYTPGTLERSGPERLVINLRELDCVTFVENAFALARLARAGHEDFDAFRSQLRSLRYRSGIIDGYASRLHYFSDWIADAETKGLVRDVTREIGGVRDSQPVDFMSTHSEAYPRLADEPVHRAELEAIRRVEAAVSARPRYYIPEGRIAEAAPRIRTGDIIAATSSVDGLDVAHTGIALWVDGELHLLHAPLVGKSVEISELPLAERILGIDGQDGIMVARPI